MSRGKGSHAEDVTAVFGMTKRELQPIVERIAGEAVGAFEITVEHSVGGHVGYSADKVIPTFAYTTKNGRKGKKTAFVKWFRESGAGEARHYEGLAGSGVPIPLMYGALRKDDREMIFLEYLEPVEALHPFHEFALDGDKFPRFLTAIARFNALAPHEDYTATLPRWDYACMVKDAVSTLDEVWDHAVAGDIGDELGRLCLTSADKLDRLKGLAGRLVAPVARMETGLCHNDMSPDSTCWRPGTREAVVVDLESVGIAPRFRDVAKWLGVPDEVVRRCGSGEELARFYIDEYTRRGGAPVAVEEFREETRVLWMAGIFEMMWFWLDRSLDGRVDWTADTEEGRRVFREDLYRLIRALLQEV